MNRHLRRSLSSLFSLLLVASLFVGPVTGSAPESPRVENVATAAVSPAAPATQKVIFFASDGMRPDIMERYAAMGLMPTYLQLMRQGMRGDNGLLQGFPPNTGVGWYTLATGAWPGEHGSTNNTFHRTGATFTSGTSAFTTGILQADTLQQAAERAGKKIASVDWVGSRGITPTLAGPVIDFRNFFSTRGVIAYPLNPAEQAGAATFNISYTVASIITATGWITTPVGDDSVSPPRETVLTVRSTFTAQNPTRVYDVYIYDSAVDGVSAYDRVLLTRSGVNKDASQAAANLGVGDWADIRLVGADGLIGARAGQTAGFYVKLTNLAGSAGSVSSFKLYFTSVARAIASCACDPNFESTLVDMFPTSTAADFAPLEAGIVDEATYVEQGLMWADFHWSALEYILTTVQPNSDMVFLGNPVTDEFSHQFMALVTPTDIDGDPNPYYDDLTNDDVPDGRVAIREGYIQSAYEEADGTLALARALMGNDTTVFASSDHGFAPQWYAVNARRVLFETTVISGASPVSVHASGETATSNCAAAATDFAKACWAGGTVQVYVNPTLPPGVTYAAVRTAVVNAFNSLTDPANPGETVVDRVMLKEQLRNVDGSDSLHPNRSGDVVVVFRPPYQSDASTAGVKIAFSQFFGQHGYLPDLVDLAHNVNMHGVFVAAGPGVKTPLGAIPLASVTIGGPPAGLVNTSYAFTATISPPAATPPISYIWYPEPDSGQGTAVATYNWTTPASETIYVTVGNPGATVVDSHAITITTVSVTGVSVSAPTAPQAPEAPGGILSHNIVEGVRAIDVAPTIAYLLGIPGPQNARGRILYEITPTGGQMREIAILNISDYHGQLVPLSEAADSVGPSFDIGGSAYLKPWFDAYRTEAAGSAITLTIAGGDSVGATPPISAFFGDTPTVQIMNAMGFSADGLGNHNFDKGEAYLRGTLIPLAQFPYLSANIVETLNRLYLPLVTRQDTSSASATQPRSTAQATTGQEAVGPGLTPAEWSPSKVYTSSDGLATFALVGFSNDDIPSLIFPGGLGSFTVTNPISATNVEAANLKAQGVDAILAFGHLGARAGTVNPLGVLTNPTGELITLADSVTAGVDAVIGDHTDFQVVSSRSNGVLVTENRSKGIRFTRMRLVVDTTTGAVVYKTADFHKPWNIGMTADPGIKAQIDALNAALQPILGTVIGNSTVEILRSDACGRADGRLCESRVGDATTDAMRTTYGVDFAITNSGGLRDRLTCPPAGGGTGFCPAYTPPPYQITRGQVLAVLPFGNVVVTLQVNGAELKTMLENGVSTMPAANGRFAQVSGLCFTYNISNTVGTRVTGAVRQAADGTCTGAAVDLTSGSTYTIAENDFMANGGDGYPNFISRATSRDIMDQVLADYITAHTPISPTIQGRIVCVGNAVPNACPVVTP